MKKTLIIFIAIVVIAGLGVAWKFSTTEEPPAPVVTNFEECIAAGNAVMESYPRQCKHGKQTFIENIGNELEKTDLIRVSSPRPNQSITSPLTITGEARGNWYFEASFPVTLEDLNGRTIAQGIATAQSEWMTPEFVPFEATLTFAVPGKAGTLVLHKDNPSGLPEHDDMLRVPVVFAGAIVPTPPPVTECTKDSDCPSPQYVCQETQGMGTACPSTDPTCVPTHTVIAGECKLRVDSRCTADSDCASGNVCNKNICVSPVGRQCSGLGDTSCPTDFECVQGCGPPVVRNGDDTPPTYVCQLKGYMRPCPICLAKNTLIDTPAGAVPVQKLQVGDPIWTVNVSGERTAGMVLQTGKTPVPSSHVMVKLALADGRTVFASPGHPTIDGHKVADLAVGDIYDGARIVVAARVPYGEAYTYDILPSGGTGFYWANGILLGSTLNL